MAALAPSVCNRCKLGGAFCCTNTMKRIRTTGMIGWIAAAVSNFFNPPRELRDDEIFSDGQAKAYAEAQTRDHGGFHTVARGRSFYGKTTGTRAAMREAKINRRWLAKQPK